MAAAFPSHIAGQISFFSPTQHAPPLRIAALLRTGMIVAGRGDSEFGGILPNVKWVNSFYFSVFIIENDLAVK
jgi:hypothetical protein